MVDVGFATFALVRVTFTIVFCTYAFRLIQTIVLGLALTSWESSQAVKFAATVRLAEEIVPDVWSICTRAAIRFRAWARMITWVEWPQLNFLLSTNCCRLELCVMILLQPIQDRLEVENIIEICPMIVQWDQWGILTILLAFFSTLLRVHLIFNRRERHNLSLILDHGM